MIYFLLVFLLALIGVDIWKNRKLLTPGIIFNGIFFVTIFLYNFELSYIQQTLSTKTLLLLFSCVVSFNIPVFISYFVKSRKQEKVDKYNKKNQNENVDEEKNIQPKIELSWKAELIIFIITAVVFVIELIYNKGCPLFWKLFKDSKTYADFSMPALNSVLYALVSIMGIYSLFKKKCYYKIFYLAIPILIISRGLIIKVVLGGLLFYLLQKSKIGKKQIIIISIIGAVGIVFFSLYGNFRTGENEFLKVAQFKEQYDWIPTSFKWIYSYMCFSLSNLNNLVSMTGGFVNFGATILNAFIPNFLGWDFPLNFDQSFLVSPNFTVSTFMPSLYLDFGFLGIIMFSLLLGFFTQFIYHRHNLNVIYKLMYCELLYNIILIFFDNMFLMTSFIVEIIILLLIFLPKKAIFDKMFKKSLAKSDEKKE